MNSDAALVFDRAMRDLKLVMLPAASALEQVFEELVRASKKFGPFKSPLEGQAIIAEEFDEFTQAVRHEGLTRAREEAVQLAAMAVRFLVDTAEAKDGK